MNCDWMSWFLNIILDLWIILTHTQSPLPTTKGSDIPTKMTGNHILLAAKNKVQTANHKIACSGNLVSDQCLSHHNYVFQ